jgi:hypothetical protein
MKKENRAVFSKTAQFSQNFDRFSRKPLTVRWLCCQTVKPKCWNASPPERWNPQPPKHALQEITKPPLPTTICCCASAPTHNKVTHTLF